MYRELDTFEIPLVLIIYFDLGKRFTIEGTRLCRQSKTNNTGKMDWIYI